MFLCRNDKPASPSFQQSTSPGKYASSGKQVIDESKSLEETALEKLKLLEQKKIENIQSSLRKSSILDLQSGLQSATTGIKRLFNAKSPPKEIPPNVPYLLEKQAEKVKMDIGGLEQFMDRIDQQQKTNKDATNNLVNLINQENQTSQGSNNIHREDSLGVIHAPAQELALADFEDFDSGLPSNSQVQSTPTVQKSSKSIVQQQQDQQVKTTESQVVQSQKPILNLKIASKNPHAAFKSDKAQANTQSDTSKIQSPPIQNRNNVIKTYHIQKNKRENQIEDNILTSQAQKVTPPTGFQVPKPEIKTQSTENEQKVVVQNPLSPPQNDSNKDQIQRRKNPQYKVSEIFSRDNIIQPNNIQTNLKKRQNQLSFDSPSRFDDAAFSKVDSSLLSSGVTCAESLKVRPKCEGPSQFLRIKREEEAIIINQKLKQDFDNYVWGVIKKYNVMYTVFSPRELKSPPRCVGQAVCIQANKK